MKFAEYLWQLLSSPFKRTPDGEARKYVEAIGHELDEAKAATFRMRRMWLVLTADGKALDLIGKSRKLPRYPGESDESYRRRLSAAWVIFSRGGTLPGMQEALRLIGYPDAVIHELFKDGPKEPFHDGRRLYDGTLQHAGGVRWAEFTVRTRIDDRDVTRTDMAVLMDTIFRLKPARSMPTAVAFELPFQDYVASRDGVEIDIWFVAHALREIFPFPGRRHDGALVYNGSGLHNGVWDLSSLQQALSLADQAQAADVPRGGEFLHRGELRYGSHPAMLEHATVAAQPRWREPMPSVDGGEQLAIINLGAGDTDRFPFGPTRHDGRFARSQIGRYSPDEVLERLESHLVVVGNDPIPGAATYGASMLRHDGGGSRWRHNGRIGRRPRYARDGRWGYSGIVTRAVTVFRYGDGSFQHDGLHAYGRVMARDGSRTHGGDGVVEDFGVVVKRHGQRVAV